MLIIAIFSLYLQLTVGFTAEDTTTLAVSPCPTNCRCECYPSNVIPDDIREVTIDCLARTSSSPFNGELLEEAERYLTARPKLARLSLQNSKLAQLPSALCRLDEMRYLDISKNHLASLPDNCLNKMKNLKEFDAKQNELVEIPDGTFSGLRNLEKINLYGNRIEYIGIKELSNSTELASLVEIILSQNRLNTCDTWPFLRAISLAGRATFTADLSFNPIYNITNTIGLDLNDCNKQGMKIDLRLNNHEFIHPMDFVTGWGFKTMRNFQCLFFPVNKKNVRMNLHDTYVCDCVDYDFIKFVQGIELNRDNAFGFNIRCNIGPRRTSIFLRELVAVQLIDVSCEVTERCPPGCKCIQRPHNSTFHIQCNDAGLLTTPFELPSSDKSKYKLEFSGNNGFILEPRDYFFNATILDVSNCGLETISDTAWQAMTDIEKVYLDGNTLTVLPMAVQQFSGSFKQLSLFNNSWSCSCNNRWIKSYLKSVESRLLHADEILCNTPERLRGKGILYLSDEEFCVDPIIRMLTVTLSSVGGFVLLVTLLMAVTYLQRFKIHNAWNFHPFDRDECDGEDMEFDAFICCAHSDVLIAKAVLLLLEANGYKVCFHARDFDIGETIDNNICKAIRRSKRTVCLVSDIFIRSNYCMREFEVALHRNIELRKNRLIVVTLERIGERFDEFRDEISASLEQFLKSHTYLEYISADYRQRLLYAMPVKRIGNVERESIAEDIAPLL